MQIPMTIFNIVSLLSDDKNTKYQGLTVIFLVRYAHIHAECIWKLMFMYMVLRDEGSQTCTVRPTVQHTHELVVVRNKDNEADASTLVFNLGVSTTQPQAQIKTEVWVCKNQILTKKVASKHVQLHLHPVCPNKKQKLQDSKRSQDKIHWKTIKLNQTTYILWISKLSH